MEVNWEKGSAYDVAGKRVGLIVRANDKLFTAIIVRAYSVKQTSIGEYLSYEHAQRAIEDYWRFLL